MATKVLYPGSFDPPHNGHTEVVELAARLFDHVVVAAVVNPQKDTSFFPLAERRDMLAESLAHLPNVSVAVCDTLVVHLARDLGADLIVKGLRTVADFELELQMAQMNQSVSGIHTVFLPAASAHSFVSSRWIREIASHGGDVSHLVPTPVAKRLAALDGDR